MRGKRNASQATRGMSLYSNSLSGVLIRQASVQADPCAAEVSCRVFWSIYTLDRLVSITLGRPMVRTDVYYWRNEVLTGQAIGDEDIDADVSLSPIVYNPD